MLIVVAGVYVMSTYGCHTCQPEYIEAMKKKQSSRNLRKVVASKEITEGDDI